MFQILYNQSSTAQQGYQNALAANRQKLAQHPTQFGMTANPDWAYRQFLSTDGRFYVVYDGEGKPAFSYAASLGKQNYGKEAIDLESQYYSGNVNASEWEELSRKIHNLGVVRTGAGRLIDNAGNFASGDAVPTRGVNDPDTAAKAYQNQDSAQLQVILDRINAGELFGPETGPNGFYTGANSNPYANPYTGAGSAYSKLIGNQKAQQFQDILDNINQMAIFQPTTTPQTPGNPSGNSGNSSGSSLQDFLNQVNQLDLFKPSSSSGTNANTVPNTWQGGNCLLLDDGEECVCPQSINCSLVCKWFRAAVLSPG